jgi:hypothetical protein
MESGTFPSLSSASCSVTRVPLQLNETLGKEAELQAWSRGADACIFCTLLKSGVPMSRVAESGCKARGPTSAIFGSSET